MEGDVAKINEFLTEDNEGRRCHVWLSYSLHVREHFLDFEKNVGALYSLQHDNLLVSTQHSMLV